MKILNYIFILPLCLMFISDSSSQQLTRRTQFPFNTYLVNPAVAGTKLYTPIMVSYRNQWAGFDGAPTTYTLSAHSSLPAGVGIGGIFFADDAGGAIKRVGAELTGAYKVDLTNEDQVSFGLSGILQQFTFDNDALVVYDPNDQALLGGKESEFNFETSFGMMVYGAQYFFGFAVPNMIQTKLKLNNAATDEENRNVRHYYFMGQYQYAVSDIFEIHPSVLTKFTAASPVQFDVSFKGVYAESLWGGFTYRHQDAIALIVGAEYNSFTMGYSYDITTTDAKTFSPHTHEITVGYLIPRQGSTFRSGSLSGKRIISRPRISK